MEKFLEPRHVLLGKNVCCHILFLASGFKANEFKIGKTDILIRPGKNHLLDKLHADISHSKQSLELRFKVGYRKFMCRVYFLALRFIGKGTFSYLLFIIITLYDV